jgi:hypothetical protein
MMWESLQTVRIVREGIPLANFDVHPTFQMCLVSPVGVVPSICDLEMKVVHTLKSADPGAVCVFHPVLPVIAAGGASGEVIEYRMDTT